jgi:hypothetical protein
MTVLMLSLAVRSLECRLVAGASLAGPERIAQ